jgi:SsrA-binding protein
MEIVNKKAKFNYEFVDTYIAGIILHGSEIKAIRDGSANISDAYCYFIGNELFLKNGIILSKAEDRKLLLNKSELSRIKIAINVKGMTIVPYKMFINDKGLCKLEIAVAKGKKTYDKRETIKKRDIERDIKRTLQ